MTQRPEGHKLSGQLFLYGHSLLGSERIWTKRKRSRDSRPATSHFSQLFGVLITQQQ